jgi:hypothetical protein
MVMTATVTPGIDVLTDDVDIPGLGHLPINAYVLHGYAPVLVDTGSIAQAGAFDAALRSVIDVADLRWIWLTTPTSTTSACSTGSLRRTRSCG